MWDVEKRTTRIGKGDERSACNESEVRCMRKPSEGIMTVSMLLKYNQTVDFDRLHWSIIAVSPFC